MTSPVQEVKQTRLTLKTKQAAHETAAWCLAWLPTEHEDILFTGGAEGTIKKWNISATDSSQAHLFDDASEDVAMNNMANGDVHLELTNTAKKSIGISPITDIKCVPVVGVENTYLLSTVSLDSYVRVYAINTNNNDQTAGIDEYKQYDMDQRHKVYLCDNNGKKSQPQSLEQYGGCWSSDINSDCSVIATGDQFGQIYLWNLVEENDEKKRPTVLQALVPHVKLTLNKRSGSSHGSQAKTLRAAHAMVRAVTFNRSTNPNWLAVSCQEAQRVEVFDIEKCVSLFNRKLTHKQIRDCVWYEGQNSPYICVACDDHRVHVYDTSKTEKNSKKALAASLPSHQSCVTSVHWGQKQFVASTSMELKLWDLGEAEDKLIETHRDHTDQIWKVRFNPKKDLLATCADDGNLCLYTMNY